MKRYMGGAVPNDPTLFNSSETLDKALISKVGLQAWVSWESITAFLVNLKDSSI